MSFLLLNPKVQVEGRQGLIPLRGPVTPVTTVGQLESLIAAVLGTDRFEVRFNRKVLNNPGSTMKNLKVQRGSTFIVTLDPAAPPAAAAPAAAAPAAAAPAAPAPAAPAGPPRPYVKNILSMEEVNLTGVREANQTGEADVYTLAQWIQDPDHIVIVSTRAADDNTLLFGVPLGGISRDTFFRTGEGQLGVKTINDVRYRKALHQAGSTVYITDDEYQMVRRNPSQLFLFTMMPNIGDSAIARVEPITQQDLLNRYQAWEAQQPRRGGRRYRRPQTKRRRSMKKKTQRRRK